MFFPCFPEFFLQRRNGDCGKGAKSVKPDFLLITYVFESRFVQNIRWHLKKVCRIKLILRHGLYLIFCDAYRLISLYHSYLLLVLPPLEKILLFIIYKVLVLVITSGDDILFSHTTKEVPYVGSSCRRNIRDNRGLRVCMFAYLLIC